MVPSLDSREILGVASSAMEGACSARDKGRCLCTFFFIQFYSEISSYFIFFIETKSCMVKWNKGNKMKWGRNNKGCVGNWLCEGNQRLCCHHC